MKVRVDVRRMVLPGQSMPRRERMALGEEIGRELSRLLQYDAPAADDRRRRSAPTVAAQIAAAVVAQLPKQTASQQMRRRS
jgi:hypothetical protein